MECPICLDDYEKEDMVVLECDVTVEFNAKQEDEEKKIYHMLCTDCHMRITDEICPTCRCVFRHPVQALNFVLNGKNVVVLHRRKRFATDLKNCIFIGKSEESFNPDRHETIWYENEGLYEKLVEEGFVQLTMRREKIIANFETRSGYNIVRSGDDFSILVARDGSGPAQSHFNILFKNKPLIRRGAIANEYIIMEFVWAQKMSKEEEQQVHDFVAKTWPTIETERDVLPQCHVPQICAPGIWLPFVRAPWFDERIMTAMGVERPSNRYGQRHLTDWPQVRIIAEPRAPDEHNIDHITREEWARVTQQMIDRNTIPWPDDDEDINDID